MITVEDNGIGFDEKYPERIFRLFERLHGRSDYEGTGIGLAIAARSSSGTAAQITAAERARARARRSLVTLPLARPTATAITEEQHESSTPLRSRSCWPTTTRTTGR